ncbi:cytochrome P450 family protein [Fodinicola feengrottensis]|uniref:Cytochrome P450 n=1 Tax=Fodinicola feengrottensis TaxID=435914 RepID=A0ABN2IZA9_9ACTN|nr:cytochrome P450 [Fodinicola feengrottensis]
MTVAIDRADPYEAYKRLREQAPVHRIEGPMGAEIWLVSRYEDARAALSDPRLSKHPRHAPQWVRDLGLVTESENPLGVNLLSTDPPDHTRLRRLVTSAFTRRRMEALRPRVQQITDALLDEMAGGTEADLLAALAFPLPVTVICELLGVPFADRHDFHRNTRASISPELTPEGLAAQREARRWMRDYMTGLVANARVRVDPTLPPDELPDLVSALVVAADERDGLSEDELVGMIQLLLVAGHETTVNLIGNGMLALLCHPDQLKLLRERPELVVPAIEELLRFDGPVERATPRYTVQDVEIAGVTIPANSMVSVVLAAADHDPAHAPQGDQLDITRATPSHLAFGHGLHFCLGAPLARLEGQIAIGTLVRRFPDLALAVSPEKLRWRDNGITSIIRGLEELPIRY